MEYDILVLISSFYEISCGNLSQGSSDGIASAFVEDVRGFNALSHGPPDDIDRTNISN